MIVVLKRALFFFIIFLSTNKLYAQVEAPNFSCIRNDTLFWSPPQVNCGSVSAFRIYVSSSDTGPYSLLITITDVNQTNFFHSNPSDELRYYYLETVADCPGQMVLQSDTLDNQVPAFFPITSVSVQTDTLILNWEPSASPEVTSYIIYRRTDLGILPVDTVFQNINSYIDFQASPSSQSEQYFVIALDPCGNTSIFDLPHRSIFLRTEVRDCDPNIYLSWNLYENWDNGVEKQEVWLSQNSGRPSLIAELNPTDSLFTFSNTLDGTNYRFFIRAIANETGYVSQSNTAERQLMIVQPLEELAISNISFNNDQSLSIEWYWQQEADLAEVLLEEENIMGENSEMLTFTNPLVAENQFTFIPFFLIDTSSFFKIQTVDQCNRVFESNRSRPIILSGGVDRNFTNTLNWTPFRLLNTEVLDYQIYKIVNGVRVLIATLDSNTNSYIDVLDSQNEEEQSSCYVVLARIKIILPNGREVFKTTQSNEVCLNQFATLLIPNAFAPDGLNNIFKPALLFGTDVQFEMQIYSRWGELVYESRNVNEGWNGRKGGIAMQGGVYVYLIRIVQPDGTEEQYEGFLTLVK